MQSKRNCVCVDGLGIHRHLYVFAYALKKRKVTKEELQKESRLSLKEAKV